MHPLQAARQLKNSQQNPDWLDSAGGQKAQKATKTIIADGPKHYGERPGIPKRETETN